MRRRAGRTAAGFALDRIAGAMARQRQAELDRFWGRAIGTISGTIHAVESAQAGVRDSFREWDKACEQEEPTP